MGITRAEFDRLLPHAIVEVPGITWRVEATEGAPRRHGLMSLPVLHVTLEVEGGTGEAVRRFVERFLLGFQRAGG